MGERNFGEQRSDSYSHRSAKMIKPAMKSTSDALVVSSENYSSPTCTFCSEQHYSDQCTKYLDVDSQKMKLKNQCFKCLKSGHAAGKCYRSCPCFYCRKKTHHRSLCTYKHVSSKEESRPAETSEEVLKVSVCNETSLIGTSDQPKSIEVWAQTAVTDVPNPDGSSTGVPIRLLLDTGSQRSFLCNNVAEKLGLKLNNYEDLSIATFGSYGTRKMRCAIVDLDLLLINERKKTITVTIVPIISCAVVRAKINVQHYPMLKKLELADHVTSFKEIELLIGVDFYYEFVKTQRLQVDEGVVALDTEFGWIPTGCINRIDRHPIQILLALGFEYEYNNVQFSIEKFWSLESVGVRDSGTVNDDDIALHNFNESIRYNHMRYHVTWPWKTSEPCLLDNYALDFGHLKSLISRLSKTPDVLQKYNEIIMQQVESNVIEVVHGKYIRNSTNKTHYIPHHCVIKPEKNTTKIRIVYDASAKSNKKNRSLNECLFRGPVLMEGLCGILMRFRLQTCAISCDIEKAFLQVGLQECERDVTRFLWLKDVKSPITEDNLITFRFCRVPFGVISSPFLLSATVAFHLKSWGSKLSEDILRNIYVDNILTGASTQEEAFTIYGELKNLMQEASMNLREWSSNSKEFISRVNQKDRAAPGDNLSILGLKWNTSLDSLRINNIHRNPNSVPTKRYVLQKMLEVFDPLGIVLLLQLKQKYLYKIYRSRNLTGMTFLVKK